MPKSLIASGLQVAGLVGLIVGCAMLATWLAFVVGGAGAVAIGVALERGEG